MKRYVTSQGCHVIQRNDFDNLMMKSYAGLHASSPILVFMTGAAFSATGYALVFAPAAIPALAFTMTILMLSAAGLMYFSLLATGEIIEVRFNMSDGEVHLLYRGRTAHTQWTIPLDDCVGARMALHYDERGIKIVTPVLDLKNGRDIALPRGTSWHEIETVRALIESRQDKTAEAWARKAKAIKSGYIGRR